MEHSGSFCRFDLTDAWGWRAWILEPGSAGNKQRDLGRAILFLCLSFCHTLVGS